MSRLVGLSLMMKSLLARLRAACKLYIIAKYTLVK